MNDVENLIRARHLIADPTKWTQGYVARTASGTPVNWQDAGACQWCATGALSFVAGSEFAPGLRWLELAALDMGFDEGDDGESGPAVLNDGTDHDTVLAMYDRAIAAASSRTGPPMEDT